MAENLNLLPDKYVLYLSPQSGTLNLGDGRGSVPLDERNPDVDIIVPKNKRYWHAPFFAERVSVLLLFLVAVYDGTLCTQLAMSHPIFLIEWGRVLGKAVDCRITEIYVGLLPLFLV